MKNERDPGYVLYQKGGEGQEHNNAKYRVKVNGNGIPYAKLKK